MPNIKNCIFVVKDGSGSDVSDIEKAVKQSIPRAVENYQLSKEVLVSTCYIYSALPQFMVEPNDDSREEIKCKLKEPKRTLFIEAIPEKE